MATAAVAMPRTRARVALSNITNANGDPTDLRKKRSVAIEGNDHQQQQARSHHEIGYMHYHDDIYENMRRNELKHYACVDYLATCQRNLTHRMRTILVNWLVEVADEYRLSGQTLHLTVYLIDSFLSRLHDVERRSKYEEIHPPTANDFSYITDHTYTTEQVLAMEQTVLVAVEFRVTAVTSVEFRRRFGGDDAPLVQLLLDLALQDPICLAHRPSQLAAAACAYAQVAAGQDAWPAALSRRSGITYAQLRPCIVALRDLHRRAVANGSAILNAKRYRDTVRIAPLSHVPK